MIKLNNNKHFLLERRYSSQNRRRKSEHYYRENIRCDVQNFGKLVIIKFIFNTASA